jgi:hypothetical protein
VGGNPADPAVDDAPGLSLLGMWGPQSGVAVITGLAALGVVLTGALAVIPDEPGRVGPLHRLPTLLAGAIGLVLAVVLPGYRLLAATAYTPILLILLALTLVGAVPQGVRLRP